MANSAALLGQLLDSWTGPRSSTPASNRNAGSPDEMGFWRLQMRAVAYLSDIEKQLRELAIANPDAETDSYLDVLPAVYKAVFGVEPVWGTKATVQGDRPAIDPGARSDLRRLSVLLEMTQSVRAMSDDEIETVRTALRHALDVVDASEDMNVRLRASLRRSIDDALAAIDDPDMSNSEKQEVLHHAGSAIAVASKAAGLDSEGRKTFRAAAAAVFVGLGLMLGEAIVGVSVEAAFEPFGELVSERVASAIAPAVPAELGSDDGEDIPVGEERG